MRDELTAQARPTSVAHGLPLQPTVTGESLSGDAPDSSVAKRSTRFAQLDAVRGLAALSVVFGHYTLLFGSVGPYASLNDVFGVLQWTPAFLLFGGHQAVLIFFILSGFVLTLMLRRVPSYGEYLWRRFTRLYLPYAAIVALAIVLVAIIPHAPIPGLSEWFNAFWTLPVTARSVVEHALFIGSFNTDQYNYVIWSLVYEMRISILFPLILIAVDRLRWQRSLTLFSGLSLLVGPLYFLTIHHHRAVADYLLTGHYILFFVLGALIAKHLEAIRERFERLSRWQYVALLSVGTLSYIYGVVPFRFGLGNPVVLDWLTVPGALILVMVALFVRPVSRFLMRPLPQFLGRISYSLYLIHPVIQLGVLHLLAGRVPLLLAIALAFVLTIPLAALSYRWIEVPSMALGHRLKTRRSQATSVSKASS